MKRQNKYRKFQLQQKNIEALEKKTLASNECILSTKICLMNFGILKTPKENLFLMILLMQWFYRLPILKMK